MTDNNSTTHGASSVARAQLTGTRCVLIIEDDPLIQTRLESLLESAGYSVTCVSTARQAREAVAAVFFPIVIIDRVLEDADGISLCADLRRRSNQGKVFVLILSMLDSQLQIEEGMRAGADAYLSKRVADAELLASLEAATGIADFGSK